MNVFIQPSECKGTVRAPAGKSSTQRAYAAALLVKGITEIKYPGDSNDDRAALDIIQRLGAKILESEPGLIRIESNGIDPQGAELNCGESGLGIRMFTPIAALSAKPLRITGTGSLVSRPMTLFDELFPLLNVAITSRQGYLPLDIKGPLRPSDIVVDGSLSSQFLTGLLMAYAGANARNVTITVNDLKSRPYIDLTLDVLKKFGLKCPVNNKYASFYFDDADHGTPAHRVYEVEADWSGGAFLLVAAAIAGPALIKGLDPGSTQADRAILEALSACGAGWALEAKGIRVNPGALYSFEFDATDCPDLFPPLTCLAAYCGGRTVLRGVNRLEHKESNRGLTLQEEFGKMGLRIELEGDYMIIHGGEGLHGAKLHSHHDHRIAMACAVAALHAEGETIITDAEAVNKSYPSFYSDLKQLGVQLSLPFQLPT